MCTQAKCYAVVDWLIVSCSNLPPVSCVLHKSRGTTSQGGHIFMALTVVIGNDS